MADQDKSIHNMTAGELTDQSLFAMAYPVNGGYASGNIAAGALGKGLGEDIDYASLQTESKKLFGAINELATANYGKVLTATLTAGQTTVTFTDSDIKADSLIDVYSDPVLNIVSDQSSAGTYAVTFEAQSSDVAVAIVIKGYGSGGGGNDVSFWDAWDIITRRTHGSPYSYVQLLRTMTFTGVPSECTRYVINNWYNNYQILFLRPTDSLVFDATGQATYPECYRTNAFTPSNGGTQAVTLQAASSSSLIFAPNSSSYSANDVGVVMNNFDMLDVNNVVRWEKNALLTDLTTTT